MGPLAGVRVLEFEAIGPGPFCGMLLADMGADVLLVDRVSDPALGLTGERRHEVMLRGRRSVTLDLKSKLSVDAAVSLASRADVVIEGFRPGVMERLGLGPDALLAANPKLVYGRMTGWGQTGPLASRAGHDIDYIALAGVLHAIGHEGSRPVPPLNLVGDFGGGGMLLAFGIACALLETRTSGRGQVVDAAMIEGAGLLSTMLWGLHAAHRWSDARGVNVLDSGAPWYDTYATRDGKFFAIGAIEPKFYVELLQRPRARGRAVAGATRPQWLARAARALRPSVRTEDARRVGAGSSQRSMPAPSRYCRSPKRPRIRTALRAARTSSSTASCNRRRHRASRAHRRKSAAVRRSAARTGARHCAIGDSTTTLSRNCVRWEPDSTDHARTTVTLQGACAITWRAIDPSSRRSNSERPRLPTTMWSMPWVSA
jgi:crotonobetainyl-CoA:carnitine CoA-transferase CaiB-like acyl-CoA transferase